MYESELTFGKERYIRVSKPLARKIGIDATILLGELYDECKWFADNKQLQNGMFFATKEKIEHETTLSRYRQDNALAELKKWCLIETALMGVPAKTYFKVNLVNLDNLIRKCVEDEQPSLRETYNTVCEKLANLNAKNSQSIYDASSYETENDALVNTPLPPTRGKRSKPEIDFESLPSMTERTEETLKRWIAFRKEIRKPITQSSAEQLVKKSKQVGDARFEEVINTSIANAWQGLYFEKKTNNTTKKRNSTDEFTRILEKWSIEDEQAGNIGDTEDSDGLIF